ncbi:response regulator transcription factor [Breznakiella homolactica]|uniref:Response regulator n=1 Tax=Breznakiella homolactica TaxID=2798577 RepID=A0A7T7XQX7_9SPIR|nr:helix-turn-helix domain-containing protein [Breznakiella homolactica]QQO10846.1 response regulator [Breznakiella homolactica]
MYRVLLADDEPIIVSGVKYLIDWERYDCQIIGSGGNGRETLDLIRTRRPDIVVCDIDMPVLSGLEVLKTASEEFPRTVFIMLTNYHDFELARESLRCRAVEYLLKNQLSPETLEKALAVAKAEWENRNKLDQVNLVNDYLETNRQEVVGNTLIKLFESSRAVPVRDAAALLDGQGMLSGYAAAYIPLDFSALPGGGRLSGEETKRLFIWQKEIILKMARSFFQNTVVLEPDLLCQSLYLFCWDLAPGEWEKKLELFREKVCKTSAQITRLGITVLGTGCFRDGSELEQCGAAVAALREWYYLMGSEGTSGPRENTVSGREKTEGKPLGLTGAAAQLAGAVRSRDSEECRAVMDKVVRRITELPHEKIQALWLCSELYDTVRPLLPGDGWEDCFSDPQEAYRQIDRLATRAEVVRWLERMKDALSSVILNMSGGHTDIIEKAKQYVEANTDRHIMLQDAAEHVGISAGYLSTLFRKQYNQHFVDYINQTKMNRACSLIRQGKYRIYEISYMLGYENAYYFTRVFRRHLGMTPSEYQKSLGAEPPAE